MTSPLVAGRGVPDREQMLITAAEAVANGSELESLSRPFLKLLHELTDLEAFFVTEVVSSLSEQRVLFADGRTDDPNAEGMVVDWDDTLCKRALETGTQNTSNVAVDLPGSHMAELMNLNTFATVPIVTSEDELLGTLCGISRKTVEIPQRVIDVMIMLAGLIGDVWERERRSNAASHRAEAVESQLRERAAFLSEAEHHLKPALQQVKGWGDLLSSRWESMSEERRDQTLAAIRSSAREALQQLEHLLDESQAEVLAEEIMPRPLSPAHLVGEVVSELRATTDQHTVVGPELEGTAADAVVRADQRALRQILWHLGENAVTYSPNGGTITFRIRADAEQVHLVVEDSGIGIPEDVDVFAPYVRGTAIDGERRGLGLHLARNLARSLGGTVTAERRLPTGSVFRVVLPQIA